MRRSIGLLAAALALAPTAQAADGADVPSVPVVTVTASATASVANDRLQAWIRAEAENASPAAAAKDVNVRIAKAIERAKAIASVTVQTSGYTTQQVAERGRPTRWRVAQTISIEGNDFAAIASLVTQLQDEDGLLLSGLTFTVSQTKRHEMEDALTQQALASWRVRAQNAARGLGLNGWRPGRVVVSTNDFARPQPMMRAGIAAAGAPAPPVPLEAGVTDVTVTVTGDAVADAARAAPR